MNRQIKLILIAISLPFGVSAQVRTSAPQSPITVIGCVAPGQRDGSLGAKATGTMATPETAPIEANSPVARI